MWVVCSGSLPWVTGVCVCVCVRACVCVCACVCARACVQAGMHYECKHACVHVCGSFFRIWLGSSDNYIYIGTMDCSAVYLTAVQLCTAVT